MFPCVYSGLRPPSFDATNTIVLGLLAKEGILSGWSKWNCQYLTVLDLQKWQFHMIQPNTIWLDVLVSPAHQFHFTKWNRARWLKENFFQFAPRTLSFLVKICQKEFSFAVNTGQVLFILS